MLGWCQQGHKCLQTMRVTDGATVATTFPRGPWEAGLTQRTHALGAGPFSVLSTLVAQSVLWSPSLAPWEIWAEASAVLGVPADLSPPAAVACRRGRCLQTQVCSWATNGDRETGAMERDGPPTAQLPGRPSGRE